MTTVVSTPGSPLTGAPALKAIDLLPPRSTLELLRQRIGLAPTDTAQDATLTVFWGSAREVLEAHLNRDLRPQGWRDELFTHAHRGTLSLRAYPVLRVESIIAASGAEITEYHVEAQNGLIHFDSLVTAHELLVRYEAAPPSTGALFVAQLGVFDILWGTSHSAGQVTAATGAVKSISSDGARVEFDVGGGAVGATGIDPESGIPAQFVALLKSYRREDA